jgi:hypothetical protein
MFSPGRSSFISIHSSGSGSTFESCTGTQVAVGLGVREGSGVDVCCGVEGAVSVALAASGSSVGDGAAGVQAARKDNMDTIHIKTLVSI